MKKEIRFENISNYKVLFLMWAMIIIVTSLLIYTYVALYIGSTFPTSFLLRSDKIARDWSELTHRFHHLFYVRRKQA